MFNPLPNPIFRFTRYPLWAFGLLLLLLAGLMPGPGPEAAAAGDKAVPGSGAALERVLERLRQNAAGTSSLAADMEQEKHLAIFSQVLRSNGRFYFRRPDCWRWEIRSPLVSGLAVCNGQGKSWSRKPDQATHFKIEQRPWLAHFTAQITAWTTANLDFLKKHYQLTLLREKPARIRLIPKNEKARRLIAALEITFAADATHVETITLRENDGDFTIIRFSHVVINQPLADDLF
jgi:outer membrane lipoprotein-sorting protein